MSPQWDSGGAPERAFLPEASSLLGPSPAPPPPAGPGIGFGAGSASKAVSSGRGGLSSTLSSRFPGPGPALRRPAAPRVTAGGRQPRRSRPWRIGRLQVAPRGSGPRGGGSRSWGCGRRPGGEREGGGHLQSRQPHQPPPGAGALRAQAAPSPPKGLLHHSRGSRSPWDVGDL